MLFDIVDYFHSVIDDFRVALEVLLSNTFFFSSDMTSKREQEEIQFFFSLIYLKTITIFEFLFFINKKKGGKIKHCFNFKDQSFVISVRISLASILG